FPFAGSRAGAAECPGAAGRAYRQGAAGEARDARTAPAAADDRRHAAPAAGRPEGRPGRQSLAAVPLKLPACFPLETDMTLKLYFAPGACSFVPHALLETTGTAFDAQMVKLHKGEQN